MLAQPRAHHVDVDAARDQAWRRREHAQPVAAASVPLSWQRAGAAAIAFDQRLDLGDDRTGIARRFVGAARGNRCLERAGALDQQVHAGGGQDRVALAQRAQIAFELVRQRFGLAMIDHARDALERMEAAEQLFEDAAVDARAGRPSVRA